MSQVDAGWYPSRLLAARYRDMIRTLPSGVISSLSVEDRSDRSQGSQGAAQPPPDKKRAIMNEKRNGRFTAINKNKLSSITRAKSSRPKKYGADICIKYHVLDDCDNLCPLVHTTTLSRKLKDSLATWVSAFI
jgi:hypothetical protein